MRTRTILGGLVVCALLAGCALNYTAPVRPPPGLIFSGYRVPVTTDFNATPVDSPKVGRSSTTYILIPFFGHWDFAFDDARIKKAAENAGIERIYYVDHGFTQVLGVFGIFETVVYGE